MYLARFEGEIAAGYVRRGAGAVDAGEAGGGGLGEGGGGVRRRAYLVWGYALQPFPVR